MRQLEGGVGVSLGALGGGAGLVEAGCLGLRECLPLPHLVFESGDAQAQAVELVLERRVLIGLVVRVRRRRERRRAELGVGAEGAVVPGRQLAAELEAVEGLARRAPVLVGGVVARAADDVEEGTDLGVEDPASSEGADAAGLVQTAVVDVGVGGSALGQELSQGPLFDQAGGRVGERVAPGARGYRREKGVVRGEKAEG